MNRVDADRLKRMPPDTFEKYLALCDGVGCGASLGAGVRRHRERSAELVRRSAAAMARVQPDLLFQSMHGMATDMHQVFVSAPRSSSSGSGFGAEVGAEDFPAEASAAAAAARSEYGEFGFHRPALTPILLPNY